MCQAAGVDVESFEDVAHGFEGDVPGDAPLDDVEVLLAGFEAIENTVEKKGLVLEAALEQAKIAAVELDPEFTALQVFQPAGSQITPPVMLHPAADGRFAQIAPGPFTFDPLETLGFLFAFHVHAGLFHDPTSRPRSASAQFRDPWCSLRCRADPRFRPHRHEC